MSAIHNSKNRVPSALTIGLARGVLEAIYAPT